MTEPRSFSYSAEQWAAIARALPPGQHDTDPGIVIDCDDDETGGMRLSEYLEMLATVYRASTSRHDSSRATALKAGAEAARHLRSAIDLIKESCAPWPLLADPQHSDDFVDEQAEALAALAQMAANAEYWVEMMRRLPTPPSAQNTPLRIYVTDCLRTWELLGGSPRGNGAVRFLAAVTSPVLGDASDDASIERARKWLKRWRRGEN